MTKDKGLSLVIILLTLLGVSLTSTLLFIKVTQVWDASRIISTRERLKNLARAISSNQLMPTQKNSRHYENDVGLLPDTLSDLKTKPAAIPSCQLGADGKLQGWCGPYWSDKFKPQASFADGWGRLIIYDELNRRLQSSGPNGTDEAGGGDDIVQMF